jgi:hypothetical protein
VSVVLKCGLALGLAVGVLILVTGFTGMYKNPSLGWVFPVVATVVELGVVIWALRQTAALKRYGGQLGTGVKVALVGGAVIIVFSLLFTMVLFPDYKEHALANAADGWRDAGLTEEQIRQQMPVAEAMVSPLPNALIGFVMTVLTGLVCSLIVAAFVRKKD